MEIRRLFFGANWVCLLMLSCLAVAIRAYLVSAMVPAYLESGKNSRVSLRLVSSSLERFFRTVCYGSHCNAQQHFIWVTLARQAISLSFALVVWAVPRYGVVGAGAGNCGAIRATNGDPRPRLGQFHRSDWDAAAVREAWRRFRPSCFGDRLLQGRSCC